MELEVLRTTGLPESSIISIRAGSTRRQAPISALDHPFKFPCKPEDCASFKVDILGQIGTARWCFNQEEETYTLPVEPSGRIPQSALDAGGIMEVAFAVRRMSEECSSEIGDSNAWRHRKEIAARDYLEEHNLVNFMQGLLQSLMKEKPDDPYAFLTRKLLTLKDPKLAARAAAEAQAVAAEKAGRPLASTSGPQAPTEGVLAGLSAVDPVSWTPGATSAGFGTGAITASRDLAFELTAPTSPMRMVPPIFAPMGAAEFQPTPRGHHQDEAQPDSAEVEAVAKIAARAREELTAEELVVLEAEAASVREKLAEENKRLLAAAGELQAQYRELLQERRLLAESEQDREFSEGFDASKLQEGPDGVMELPTMWVSSPNSKASVTLAENASPVGDTLPPGAQKESVPPAPTAPSGTPLVPFAAYYKDNITCCGNEFWQSLYPSFGVQQVAPVERSKSTTNGGTIACDDDDDTPRTRAWKFTYMMQAELDEMAKSNAKLREELHKVREAVQGTHDQIKGMREQLLAEKSTTAS